MTERSYIAWVSVAAFLGGALVSLLATVVHQAVWYIGSFPISWGLVLAGAIVICYLVGVRLAMESRWPSLAAALGVIGAAGIGVFESAGGSVLVPGNLWGTIWAIAPSVIAVAVVAWPRFRKPSNDATAP